MMRLFGVFTLFSILTILAGCGGGGQNAEMSPTPTPTPAPTPTPTPAIANTVSVAFASPTPVAVAERIGGGSWTVASLPSNATLSVGLPSGVTQYGIAFLCTRMASGSPVNNEWIIEADLKDGASYSLQMCNPNTPVPQPTGTFTGSMDATAIPGAHTLDAFINGSGDIFENAITATINGQFPAGIGDLYAVAYDSTATIAAMKILRSQTVPGMANGGNPITLTASDQVAKQPISITNTPSGFPPPTTIPSPTYVTGHGSFIVGDPITPSTQYAVVSAANAQSGDYYSFTASAGTTTQIVLTRQYLATANPVTLTLPNPWSPMAPTPATFPAFTFDYTGFSGQPEVTFEAGIAWNQGFNGLGIFATANHQNGTTTLTIPDLTSLPGFLAPPPSGSTVTWVATTFGGTALPYLATQPVPQTLSSVLGEGSFTQP